MTLKRFRMLINNLFIHMDSEIILARDAEISTIIPRTAVKKLVVTFSMSYFLENKFYEESVFAINTLNVNVATNKKRIKNTDTLIDYVKKYNHPVIIIREPYVSERYLIADVVVFERRINEHSRVL